MTRRLLHVGLFLFVFASTSRAQDRQTPLPNVLSALQGTTGFEAAGSPVIYDGGTLDSFEDRLTPALKLYGSKGVAIQEGRVGNDPVKVTLFQMLDAPAAYGVYTAQRTALGGQSTPVVFGAASFQRQNELCFWQANYAVRIQGGPETREQLARSLSRSILGQSRKPPVSAYLPADNLVEGTEKYLLSADAVDPSVGIDAEHLGFDSSAEAATATYRVEGRLVHLLLVLYPTQHIARKYAEAMDAANGASALRKRSGPLVAIIYGSSNESLASSILGGVNHQFKVTWEEPLPGLGVGTMLITIFTFIGIALVFTTVIGVSYGGLRVFMKTRYPEKVFDRPEAMEIIQLKLAQGVTERRISDNSGGAGS